MPKPPTSLRSIRLPVETWAWLAEEAGKRGTTVNALVARAVEQLKTPKPLEPPVRAAADPPKFAGRTALGEPLPVKRAKPKGQK